MEQDKEKTRVLFVYPRYDDGQREVLAIFPDQRLFSGAISCYAHVGQHGSCSYSFLKRTKATKEQYTPLLKELQSIGYNVEVVNERARN